MLIFGWLVSMYGVTSNVTVSAAPSKERHCTVVVFNNVNVDPDGGSHTTPVLTGQVTTVDAWYAATPKIPPCTWKDSVSFLKSPTTVTSNCRVAAFLTESIAVHVTTVRPTPKVDPGAGTHV
jgi:hypothetical protein